MAKHWDSFLSYCRCNLRQALCSSLCITQSHQVYSQPLLQQDWLLRAVKDHHEWVHSDNIYIAANYHLHYII